MAHRHGQSLLFGGTMGTVRDHEDGPIPGNATVFHAVRMQSGTLFRFWGLGPWGRSRPEELAASCRTFFWGRLFGLWVANDGVLELMAFGGVVL